eukprot:7346323-Prymnesium_polylepis.1
MRTWQCVAHHCQSANIKLLVLAVHSGVRDQRELPEHCIQHCTRFGQWSQVFTQAKIDHGRRGRRFKTREELQHHWAFAQVGQPVAPATA